MVLNNKNTVLRILKHILICDSVCKMLNYKLKMVMNFHIKFYSLIFLIIIKRLYRTYLITKHLIKFIRLLSNYLKHKVC